MWINGSKLLTRKRRAQEKPLKLISPSSIAILTEKKKHFYKLTLANASCWFNGNRSSSSMPMPDSLRFFFPSTEDIPVLGSCTFDYAASKERWFTIERNISNGKASLPNSCDEIAEGAGKSKERLDQRRPLFEAELAGIESRYHRFS